MKKSNRKFVQGPKTPSQEMAAHLQADFVKLHPEFEGLTGQALEGAIADWITRRENNRKARLKQHLEFFSDAVIAIIITIMLLEIQVPGEHVTYMDFIRSVGIFLVSFFIMADLWFDHHRLFDEVETITDGMIVCDFVFMGTLAMLPILTKWIMEAPSPLAVVNYGICNLTIRILQIFMTYLLDKERYKGTRYMQRFIKRLIAFRVLIMLGINGALTVFSAYHPGIGHWLFISLPMFSFFLSSNSHSYERALEADDPLKTLFI